MVCPLSYGLRAKPSQALDSRYVVCSRESERKKLTLPWGPWFADTLGKKKAMDEALPHRASRSWWYHFCLVQAWKYLLQACNSLLKIAVKLGPLLFALVLIGIEEVFLIQP